MPGRTGRSGGSRPGAGRKPRVVGAHKEPEPDSLTDMPEPGNAHARRGNYYADPRQLLLVLKQSDDWPQIEAEIVAASPAQAELQQTQQLLAQLQAQQQPSNSATTSTDLKGWPLILYVNDYLIGKRYNALGDLGKQQPDGANILATIARFFDAAARHARS